MAVYKYYLSDHAYAYPSSNATDGGEDNSELNLKTITDKFAIKSFVVRRADQVSDDDPTPKYEKYFIPTSSDNGSELFLSGGECSISGYYFSLGDTSIKINDKDDGGVVIKLTVNKKYHIIIKIYQDSLKHLRGDGYNLSSGNADTLICKGVSLSLVTDEELAKLDPSQYLHLADFTATRDGKFPDDDGFNLDPMRFSFVDSETILTASGQKIEEWVQNLLNYALDHLNELHFYKESNQTTTPDGKWVVSEVDGRIDARLWTGDIWISFRAIEDRTQVAESGQKTKLKSDNLGDTYNGTSKLIARADHDHDERYLMLNKTTQQVVKGPVNFDNSINVGTIHFDTSGSANFNKKAKIDTSGNITNKGNITAEGTITGSKVFNAVWNDYAELFLKDDINDDSPAGTVIAKVTGKDTYAPVTGSNRRLVVGVVSDSYGVLIGGDKGVSEEDQLKKYYPVALTGRVRVKVPKDVIVREGDILYASETEVGCASPHDELYGTMVGKALESSDGSKDRILMMVCLG